MSIVTYGVDLFPIEPLLRMLELTKLAEEVGCWRLTDGLWPTWIGQ
jgi:hypothetical protein